MSVNAHRYAASVSIKGKGKMSTGFCTTAGCAWRGTKSEFYKHLYRLVDKEGHAMSKEENVQRALRESAKAFEKGPGFPFQYAPTEPRPPINPIPRDVRIKRLARRYELDRLNNPERYKAEQGELFK